MYGHVRADLFDYSATHHLLLNCEFDFDSFRVRLCPYEAGVDESHLKRTMISHHTRRTQSENGQSSARMFLKFDEPYLIL